MEITQEQQMYAEIVQKAWEDAQFKADLVANPVATIEQFTGKKLNIPEGKTLVVRDQTDEQTVYINIPAKNANAELSEEELEAVTGGIVGGPNGCIKNPWDILGDNLGGPTGPNKDNLLS